MGAAKQASALGTEREKGRWYQMRLGGGRAGTMSPRALGYRFGPYSKSNKKSYNHKASAGEGVHTYALRLKYVPRMQHFPYN